jgi:hypothetical protein
MRLSLITFLFLFSLVACSSTDRRWFNAWSNQGCSLPVPGVYLEEVTYTSRNALDTAVLDARRFSVSATLKNQGLYQLRVGDKRAIFLCLMKSGHRYCKCGYCIH